MRRQAYQAVAALVGVATATGVSLATAGSLPRAESQPALHGQEPQSFVGHNQVLTQSPAPAQQPEAQPMKNPGRFDDAFMEAKGLLGLDPIEGLRLNTEIPVPSMDYSVRADLGVAVGNPELPKPAHATLMLQASDPTEGFVVMAQMDSTKRTVARVAGPLTNATTFNGQVAWDGDANTEVALADVVSYEAHAVYGGRYMHHVQAGNVVTAHYMQAVTPLAGLGIQTTYYADSGRGQTELKYGWEREYRPVGKALASARVVAEKLTEADPRVGPMVGGKEEYCVTASTGGSLSGSYYRRVNHQLAFAADCEIKASSMRALTNVGLQYKTPNTTHSVVVSSEGVVHMSTTGTPTPFIGIDLSVLLDHSTDKAKVGLGVRFGAQRANW
jgi:hypothetical protein